MAIRIALFDCNTRLTTSFRGSYFSGANPMFSRKIDGLYIDLLARILECNITYRCKHTMYLEYGISQEKLISNNINVPDIVEYTYVSTRVTNRVHKVNPKTVIALNAFNPEILISHCKDPIDLVCPQLHIKVGYPNMAGKLCVNINGDFISLHSDNPELEQWKVASDAIESYIVSNFAKE